MTVALLEWAEEWAMTMAMVLLEGAEEVTA
jgi:hypothetical protein